MVGEAIAAILRSVLRAVHHAVHHAGFDVLQPKCSDAIPVEPALAVLLTCEGGWEFGAPQSTPRRNLAFG